MEGFTLIGLLGVIVGAASALVGAGLASRRRARTGGGLAERIIQNANREAETIVKAADLAAKEDLLRRRERLEAELDEFRRQLRDQERRLDKRGDAIEERFALLERRERELDLARQALTAELGETARRRVELDEVLSEQRDALLKVAGMSAHEARDHVLKRIEDELSAEVGGLILKHQDAVRETSAKKAREILISTIQRYAAAHTAETTVSTVDIPNDEMKGRIIGREGRNIRAFERATGVDLIVDDTPGVVIVTGFDSLRREIAKVALEKLIQDGRIHPARIEEIVVETRESMEGHVRELGSRAALEADVAGLHEKLLDYLGRLHFRTSYSQNVLRHSLEVAFLTGMLAEELGLDGALGRRCGLLHDVGKAADHEMEGGHPAVGAELVKRYGESTEVIHAALGHHDDLRVETPYTMLVASADAVSASRPGARRETLEKYVRRLEELESLALGFPGVDQAYAVQAGREIRVMVDSRRLGDLESAKLCRELAQSIQSQLAYPGEVKVTVLRETRTVEYAR